METSDDLWSQILAGGASPGTLFFVLSKLKKEGRLKKVIQECLKALDFYPYDIHIRRLLAEAYFEEGLISRAETELEKATTLIADLITAYKLQAEIYKREGRREEAFEAIKLYLAHRPGDQEALRLIETLKHAEETPIAEPRPDIEEVTAPVEEVIDEDLPEIATPTLAEIYFNQGQIEEAIDTYEKVLEQNPQNKRSRQRLEELKARMKADTDTGDKKSGRVWQKNKKMIAILEAWLANIQEMSKTSPLRR